MLADTWLRNDAGPLLLLPESLLPNWSGIVVPGDRTVVARFRWNDHEPRASDYDRACDVDDYVSVIPVGHGEGLVLNDSPCATRWVQRDHGGWLARWEYADHEAAMDEAIAGAPENLDWEPKGEFLIVSSPLSLFNSGEPGLEPLQPRLQIQLRPGLYEVRWTRYAPERTIAVGLIELRRAAT